MNRLNKIFTLSSISVVLVTLERYSFTTNILLQPHNFMRLHELVQILFIILLTVLISALFLKEATKNFDRIKSRKRLILFLAFITGVYFYASGNGVHELGSFYFNQNCDSVNFSDNLCSSFFVNDYYTGNILFFIGATLMTVSILLFERRTPHSPAFSKKDFNILLINSVVYAGAIFAYSAYDTVLVGMVYSAFMMFISGILFFQVLAKYKEYPIISYTFSCYLLGTVAALVVRLGN